MALPFGGRGAGAGGVKRRVLDQPNEFRRCAGRNLGDPALHQRKRRLIVGLTGFDVPFRRRKSGPGGQGCCKLIARVNHRFTIAW